jgi:thiosulfate dehydrogenase [quinone] large subunit
LVHLRLGQGHQPGLDEHGSFLQYLLDTEAYVWFAKLVAVGEVLVAVALVLGLFTGVAAFFGAFMNWNFMMAGTASSNPLLFVVAIGLVLAWKVAGYYGLDRYVLPLIGTPWQIAPALRGPEPAPAAPHAQPVNTAAAVRAI